MQKSIVVNDIQTSAHNNLGGVYLNLGQNQLAARHLIRALEIDPRNHLAWNNLGTLHQSERKPDEAIECYRNALDVCSNHPDATLNMGISLYEKGLHEQAMPFYERYLGWNPEYAQAHSYLAELHESLHNLDQAEQYATQALDLDPTHPGAKRIQATLLRRKGCPREGLELLKKSEIPDDPVVAQSIHFELGKSYDQLRDSDSAFWHFCEGNRYLSSTNNPEHFNKQNYLSMLDDLHGAFTPDWIANWRARSASVHGQTPFFLVGFPRSGTTLLDQILDSHPLIQVIEEQPMLDVLKSMISKLPGGYPEALSTLEEADIQELRKAYCSLLNKFTSTSPDKILIDKYPLNLIHVGLIKAIFPHAKFIFALRHPCDVVLSCFMQPFKLNNAMANFYNLEDSAYLYHRAMGLWIKYTGLFAFDYHTVKYEQLVDSFELVIRELFAFLKVDWHDGVLNYAEHARHRGRIKTPSYNQVTQPIYQDAKYRWRRYEKHLEVVMDDLNPYIRQFKYD